MHPSLLFLKDARPFILHFVLIVLSVIVILCFIDPPGANPPRVYNLNYRRPRFTELDGSPGIASSRHTKPLQSDITTSLSLLASATRAAAAWWAGKFLWRCAFIFMEKSEITLTGFSKVVSGGITTLLPPRHVSTLKNWLLVYAIIFICFSMDYFSAILTGSVTWQSASTLVDGGVPLTNLTEGIPGRNIKFYKDRQGIVSKYIEYAGYLALVSWGVINTNSSNLPVPSNLTRRAIIQDADFQSIEYLPPNSTLKNVRVPYFKVENFEYITDPKWTLTSQRRSLLNDSSPYNPYLFGGGHVALFPDAFWGPDTTILRLPPPVNVSESRILGIRYHHSNVPHCKPLIGPKVPPNLRYFPISIVNGPPYTCFIFANVTYTAGAAICEDCKIVSPIVVQENIGNLQLISDPLTNEALAITSPVATHIYNNYLSNPVNYTTHRDMAMESISRAYQCAWSSLVLHIGTVDQNNQTSVMVAVPASQPSVLRWRVYLWASLHMGVLLGGMVFVYFRSRFRHPWVADPVTAAFLLDTTGIFKRREADDPEAMDPWNPDAKYPAGKLRLKDYDSSRPGHPRTVVLTPTRSTTRSGYQQLDSESDIFLTRFR